MKTCYEILQLPPRATSKEVEAAFRRAVARYRPTLSVEQLATDTRFLRLVNAYLTLSDVARAAYDREVQHWQAAVRAKLDNAPAQPESPTPFAGYAPHAQQLLLARIAYWRREPLGAIHLLRMLLQREPDYAPAWALMGEVYLVIDRLEEGVQAYAHAVHFAPMNTTYAARLAHARAAAAGEVALRVELSPEEELLRAARRRRWRVTFVCSLLATAIIVNAIFTPCSLPPSALYVPWWSVGRLALGTFLLFFGLGYGRLLLPFERAMLWSSLPVSERGRTRSYPFGLLLFVTTLPSLWFSVVALLVMAVMDEEWPISPSILLGSCALLTLAMTLRVYDCSGHQHWGGMLFVGGNALVLTAMLGWWVGSLNMADF